MRSKLKLPLLLLLGCYSFFLKAQLPNVGLLKDIAPGSSSSSPTTMIKLGSIVIFRANDGTNGTELWKTDGTAAGTVMVKNINPSGNSSPFNFVVMGGFVYFTANDGTNGGALWRTDGSTAGTTLVKDVNPTSTSSSSSISQLTAIGSRLYFRGDDGTNGEEPWISDGTPGGTMMLKNIAPGSASSSGLNCPCFGTFEFVEFNGFVYFNANDQNNSFQQNSELWRTDGTTAGTVLFKDNYGAGAGGPGNLVNAGSFLFFTSDNQSITGYEPWKSDGTVAGTVMIKDIFTSAANAGSILGDVPTAYMNGYVYFVAIDVYYPANFNLDPPQSGYINAELWRTDGTAANTTKVKEINPGMTGLTADANPSNFFVFNNKLYFTATDGTNGTEPWVSDGTAAGTFMLKNIDPAGNSNPFGFTAFNGYVYFSADDNSTNGTELWRTDGTAAGTVLVKNINPGNSNSSPSGFTALDGSHMLFGATSAIAGSELYILGGYNVTVTTSANGTVDPPGTISTGNTIEVGVKSGTSQTFNFTPSGGFSVQSVLVDGSSVGASSSYTFSNISANHTLNVSFAMGVTNFTINASAGSGGTISPSGAVTVASGGNQSFNINPNSGFCIQSVTVDGVNQGAISSYTFSNVTANHTIVAAFSAATTYYRDMDNDGFGNPSVTTTSCSGIPSGYVANNTDCNDNSALEKPGQVWYKDTDNDGYAQTGAATITQCARPVGYKAASELTSTTGDCDDSNAAIKPSATEVCDGIDNNCNSMTDEGVQTTYYRDMDNDGFGNPSVTTQACSVPSGYVTNNTDCNDNSALEKPGQVWYKDTDNDGYAQTGAATITQCSRPVGYKAASELTSTTGDCNDNAAAINPAATEVCDGVDNNCNSMTDEGVQTTYYRDMDNDGFGNPSVTTQSCSLPSGYVTNNTDCNDNSALEKPGQVWYKDTDNDGYAQTGAATITQCSRPVGYKAASELTSTTGDCNDNAAAINPAATEVCDGVDNNCNSMTDEGVQTTYYRDMDNDGFGNPSVTTQSCSVPSGYVANNTDCNDNNALEKPGQVWYKDTDNDSYAQTGAATITQCARPMGYKAASELTSTTGDCNDNAAAINPAATEVCDGVDNNCNSMTDEGVQTTYYRDMDNDSFGNPSVTTQACSAPSGYVANNTDCNDNSAIEKPGQVWYKDTDNDGYAQTGAATITQCSRPIGYKAASELTSTTGDCNDNAAAINPAATEVCDGVDNNCNSMTDEGVLTTFYRDIDMDTYGNPSVTTQACSAPSGYVANNTDCNDNDPLERPGQVWYKDTDNDGYAQTGAATITQCTRPSGYKVSSELTATTGDCNDSNAAINPSVSEVCDGIDNNCNSMIDEGVLITFYRDMDMDSYGNPSSTTQACTVPSGYVSNDTDCNDNNALEHPGQTWYADADNDGYSNGSTLTQCARPANYKVASELTATTGDCNDANAAVNPAAIEICNNIDDDCDNLTDEGGTGTPPGWGSGNIGGATNTSADYDCNSGTSSGTVFNVTSQGFSGSSNGDVVNSSYQQRCGDASITAHIVGSPAPGWAGLYIREDLSSGSKMVALKTNLSSYLRREVRSTTNGAKVTAQFPLYANNTWVRIVRTGNNFSFYTSPNGTTWTLAGTTTVTMSSCVYLGLFAESINASTPITASFDNVDITGGTTMLAAIPDLSFEVQEAPQALDFDLFPNPTTGAVNVDLTLYAGKPVQIEVYNLLGRLLYYKSIDEVRATQIEMDLSDYTPGNYLIRVKTEDAVGVTKWLIKQD